MSDDFASKQIPDARLDAELILAHVLGVDRIRLYMDMDRPLQEAELGGIRGLVKRRRLREPMAYIRGEKEFYGRRFSVTPAVLIPRPETEILVEKALDGMSELESIEVLDVCTGSGAIALTLAAERPAWHVTASDISAQALAIAQQNKERLDLAERVRFVEGDLFANIDVNPFALVTANPPYIAEQDWDTLAEDITLYEPRLALTAGADGLAIARRIILEAEPYVATGGRLLMEIGQGQDQALTLLARQQPWIERIEVYPDLRGIPRVLELHRLCSG